jgi:hypothetical protein
MTAVIYGGISASLIFGLMICSACSYLGGSPPSTVTATVDRAATMHAKWKTLTPPNTATPLHTLARLPTIQRTETSAVQKRFYDLGKNFSFIPPAGWQVDYSGTWRLGEHSVFNYSSKALSGTVDAYIRKYKNAFLSEATQPKITLDQDYSTAGGIAVHELVLEYQIKENKIRAAAYFFPFKGNIIEFFYGRFINEGDAETDKVVDESIDTLEWIFP